MSISRESQKPRLPVMEQVSAGGVVARPAGDTFEVALICVGPSRRWQLPKGLVDEGEKPHETALREVREEAGLQADLNELLDSIEYWYIGEHAGQRVRFHKYVFFYLLTYRSGDVGDHDHEVEEARWVTLDEAIRLLSFKSERALLEKAAIRLLKV